MVLFICLVSLVFAHRALSDVDLAAKVGRVLLVCVGCFVPFRFPQRPSTHPTQAGPSAGLIPLAAYCALCPRIVSLFYLL